ncbi:hypothetical protein L3i20_v244520 [Paenibacillus sp. L3-i20]|nr:hypothetical protein L3i20_v244520 [Paenibacillus sp. L3-i20]
MLGKRYAFLTVAPVLYSMTVYNKGLILSLESCRLEPPDGGAGNVSGSKFPELHLSEYAVTEPKAGARQKWREDVVRSIFADHLTKVFRSLSQVGGVPMAILWENAFVRIIRVYEEESDREEDLAAKVLIHEDFDYIVRIAEAGMFGERRNPLTQFVSMMNNTTICDTTNKLRKTCCLYYEISSEYCLACPKPAHLRS